MQISNTSILNKDVLTDGVCLTMLEHMDMGPDADIRRKSPYLSDVTQLMWNTGRVPRHQVCRETIRSVTVTGV